MNPTDTIEYITKQAEFCAAHAKNATTVADVHAYAIRADIYYTLATALAIFFGTTHPKVSRDLDDAEDKTEPRGDLRNTEGPWSGGFADNH